MSSTEIQKLKSSVADLKAGLMNFPVRTDGAYEPEELLRCRAFIAFAHAEAQVYLERVASRILDEAFKRWKEHGTYDRVISTLLVFRRPVDVSIPEDPKAPQSKSSVETIIESAFHAQRKAIADNNGIKRNNFSKILCPLGVLPDDLEEVLLIQLDEIGKKRGDLVHKTNQVSIRYIRDPFTDEQQDIDNLVIEVAKFDATLERNALLSISVAAPAACVLSEESTSRQ